jgi:hypothetical protein
MAVDPFGLAIGLTQMGLGIGKAFAGPPPDTSGVTQAVLQNSAIQASNRRTEQIWQARLNQVKNQYEYNKSAADRAFNSLQFKEQEQLEGYLMQRQSLLKQLMEVQGKYGAREVYGKSAARVASQPEREYGQTVRVLQENLVRFSEQTDRDLAEVARQWKFADEAAFAGISVPPAMLSQIPVPGVQSASGLNTALQIGSATLSGVMAYQGLAAPENKIGA